MPSMLCQRHQGLHCTGILADTECRCFIGLPMQPADNQQIAANATCYMDTLSCGRQHCAIQTWRRQGKLRQITTVSGDGHCYSLVRNAGSLRYEHTHSHLYMTYRGTVVRNAQRQSMATGGKVHWTNNADMILQQASLTCGGVLRAPVCGNIAAST